MNITIIPSQLIRVLGLLICLLAALMSHSATAAVVLQYHHVNDATPPSTSISPELFEQHLQYIEQNDYQVWPLSEVVAFIRQSKALPDKLVVITFDDAYRSIYQAAYPLLKARNWPFTVFVATEPVEQKLDLFMSWEELKEMSQHGATIANHTHSHAHLVRRRANESKAAWLDRVQDEITQAEDLLLKNIGTKPGLFAYPYGEYTPEVQDVLKELDYTAFGQQSGAIGAGMDMTALPRFPMTNRFGAPTQFQTKVASLPLAIKDIQPSVKLVKGTELDGGLSIVFDEHRPGINCFFEGEALDVTQNKTRVTIKKLPTLPVGRSRINCTAPSAQANRFYWFSHSWIKPNPDGSWYAEQ